MAVGVENSMSCSVKVVLVAYRIPYNDLRLTIREEHYHHL